MARFYHGTSLHRYQEMQRSGFVATSPLYIADTPEGTDMYRQFAVEEDTMAGVEEDGNAEVLLTLDSDILLIHGSLQPDWDDLWNAYNNGEIEQPPTELTWRDSLVWGGTASYVGSFATAVLEVEVIR